MKMKKLFSSIVLSLVFVLSMQTFVVFASSDSDEPDYILGRPMTEEEIRLQQSYEPKKLTPIESPKRYDNSDTYTVSAPSSASYPARFSSLDKGWVTPAKQQYDSNWCWSYATTSAMETSLIKNKVKVNGKTATRANTDLSEAALAYYMYNRTIVRDPMGNATGDRNNNLTDGSNFYDFSGNNIFLAEFLSTNMGIKNESYYTIENAMNGKLPNTSQAYSGNVARLKNVRYVTNNINSMKAAISGYGSITGLIYYDSYYFNYNTGAYSCPISYTTNHSVNIVGWDDSYSYRNFDSASEINRNGAWIVKNSWGTEWGNNGFFYVSYYDSCIEPATAIEMQSESAYDNTYFYDGSSSNSYRCINSSGKFANVFTAAGKQQIKQVSFELMAPRQSYSIQIYKNVSGTKPIGTPMLSKAITGTSTTSGIYTVSVPENIFVNKGEQFSVVVTLKSNNASDSLVYIGAEESYNYGWFSNNASIAYGQSLFQQPGYSWTDAASEGWCARIKAYTDNINGNVVLYRNTSGRYLGMEVVSAGKTATFNPVAKKGYTIKVHSGRYRNLTSDSTVTISYSPNIYTIRFNANGGTVSTKTKKIKYHAKYGKMPAPKRSGYDFLGWYTSRSFKTKATANSTYVVGGNRTLYARWRKITIKKSGIRKLTKKSSDSVQVSIAKIPNATAYQIVYSTTPDMKSAVKVNSRSNLKVLTGLKRGRTYYVKVRAYRRDSTNTPVCGAFSVIKHIKL